MTFYHIFYTFLTDAFNLWQKFFWINYLINFCTTGITSINCDLYARFNITASGNNTFEWHQWPYLVRFDFPHQTILHFPRIAFCENQSKVTFKFWRKTQMIVFVNLLYSKLRNTVTLKLWLTARGLVILSPLCHNNIMWGLYLCV